MKYRKLRIAWSIGCGILCLLLIGLWVRSYLVFEGIAHFSQASIDTTSGSIISNNGILAFSRRTVPTKSITFPYTEGWSYERGTTELAIDFRFAFNHGTDGLFLLFPTWFPVPFIFVAAGIPWMELRWQFSLRTLLVGMTVAAVLLGLVIWAAR